MSTRPSQRAAVDAALKMRGDGGLVHVYGPPEARLARERYCTEEHGDHVVVYHVRSVVMSNGGWMCLACGHASEEPDGTA